MTGGVQNLCHVGQLMIDSYLPQDARAIACPREFTRTGKQNSMYTMTNVAATLKQNWRGDDYSGGPSYSYRSTNYVIRGPIYKVPRLANVSRTAFMADHERDNQSNAGLPDGANPILYGWPFVHAKGFNIAYYDGHARFFADPQRITTFNRWPGNNQTRWYGNGDALYIGRYDKE
jgi:prepilin-type processing-associated H-X9-DG protein